MQSLISALRLIHVLHPRSAEAPCWQDPWLIQQRQKVPGGSVTTKTIDYSLKRWVALTRYVADGDLPIDNNWVENRVRPIAIG